MLVVAIVYKRFNVFFCKIESLVLTFFTYVCAHSYRTHF